MVKWKSQKPNESGNAVIEEPAGMKKSPAGSLFGLSWEICFYLISLIEHQWDVDYNVVQEMNGGMDEDV